MWDREPALVPSQPLGLYTESVALEWKQVCKVAEEGLGRKPAFFCLFCVFAISIFWTLRKA